MRDHRSMSTTSQGQPPRPDLYAIVYVSTAGGPGNSTAVPGIQIYILAFTEQRIGPASALAVILMVLVLIIIIPIQRLNREASS